MSYDEHLISMAGGDGDAPGAIPAEAVKAAANAISECSGMRFDGFWSEVDDLEPEDRVYALTEARAALEAASPYMREAMAEVWQQAYWQGCADERSATEANIGYGPNRANPYRAATVRADA